MNFSQISIGLSIGEYVGVINGNRSETNLLPIHDLVAKTSTHQVECHVVTRYVTSRYVTRHVMAWQAIEFKSTDQSLYLRGL